MVTVTPTLLNGKIKNYQRDKLLGTVVTQDGQTFMFSVQENVAVKNKLEAIIAVQRREAFVFMKAAPKSFFNGSGHQTYFEVLEIARINEVDVIANNLKRWINELRHYFTISIIQLSME